MNIYTSFVPTYLYIKQHSVTGLLYFGKTIQDPLKYVGSGTRWVNHINKHGKQFVETIWYCLFLDKESIVDFAIKFSNINNISKYKSWANLKPENGLDGGSIKNTISEETRNKLSLAKNGNKYLFGHIPSEETKQKISDSLIGNTHRRGKLCSEETKIKMSKSRSGKTWIQIVTTCPHCGKEGGMSNMTRYHFDNCKFNQINISISG